MTEDQWNECREVTEMLWVLHDHNRLTPRKARLFACACCRRVWHLLGDERGSRGGVEVMESFADGSDCLEDIGSLAEAAAGLVNELDAAGEQARFLAVDAVYRMLAYLVEDTPHNLVHFAGDASLAAEMAEGEENCRPEEEPDRWGDRREAAAVAQATLLREMFRYPPQAEPILDPAWQSPSVSRLARASYEERLLPNGHIDNQRLAVLADALEDAGCNNQEVLGHLREQGEVHVRGCWVIDLLLNKK